ncbi:MAG: phenylalanine--tRNA ligase subunit alpha [Candidatus Aenigmarchaeota archaeon]|nr:phenylalanine--tRNA ligase subunit alpha [Candidatus Aenigmarchaeota archaeon]
MEDLIEKLHEYEKRILVALKNVEKLSLNELSKKTGLKEGSLVKACGWARTKGIVDVLEEKEIFVKLSDEGLRYAENGLPEKNLIKRVEEGVTSINELKNSVENFEIALVWAKKNGWIEISEGKVSLTESGKNALSKTFELEKYLSSLKTSAKKVEDIPHDVLETLKKRKLVEFEKKTKFEVKITELGKKLVPLIEKDVGKVVTQLTPEIIKSQKWKGLKFQKYDVKLPVPKTYPGKRHFLQEVLEYIKRVWIEMGFKEMKGPLIEVSFWNFDALFQPQDHPARDLADTLYVKKPKKGKLPDDEIVEAVKQTHQNGWTTGSKGWGYEWDEEFSKKLVFRTHTTALSARTLAQLRKDVENGCFPAKYFAVGRVFRNETLDWKHLIEFHQTEGIVVDPNVNFKHLLGYLKTFFEKLGFKKIRFRPAYFPYTEMSVEPEVWHPEHKQWIELGGAGIFRPEVVKPLLGVDVPVLAWGLGLERPVMLAYNINDIRQLYWNDLKMLRESKIWLG